MTLYQPSLILYFFVVPRFRLTRVLRLRILRVLPLEKTRPRWLTRASPKLWTRARGKGKVTKPKKPALIPLWTSGALKIESRGPAPQAQPTAELVKKTSSLEKRPADTPPHVARVLKLIDESEDLEAQQPLETAPGPIPTVPTPGEELDVEVVEASLVKKRKLTKAVEVAAPEVEAKNVASFLATQRKQMPKPSVPCMADVEAFLANELFEASLVNAAKSVLAEPLQAPGGPIPTKLILGHLMGSNIQDILDNLDLESENSVGMRDDIIGSGRSTVRFTDKLCPCIYGSTCTRVRDHLTFFIPGQLLVLSVYSIVLFCFFKLRRRKQ
jgi:hypothetical protein